MPPLFPLIPTSAAGDPFCTESFCQDNSGTDNDVLYYTSKYRYVRFRAVWTVSVQGVLQTWPLRNNPGIPVYYSNWFVTQGTKSIFLLDTPNCSVLSFLPCRPIPPEGTPYPFGNAEWLINYTGRFGFNGSVSSQGSLPMYRRNSGGYVLESHGGTGSYNNSGAIGDFWASIAGMFEFTNGPLISVPGYPSVSSTSAIVSWEGLPVPSNWT